MRTLQLAALLAIAACGPETTSFRTTDSGDNSERAGPPAAAYHLGSVATVRVWSNGGYIGSSDEPMTHVGFEIRNAGATPIVFDADALQLVALDRYGASLPGVAFTALTPLGPSQQPIAAGTTAGFDAYFLLPVRPRVVGGMRVRWSLRIGTTRFDLTTSFVRDDDYPVSDPPRREPASARS